MAEDICFFTKDTLVIKGPTKKTPLALRMVVLLFAMACGFYICLITLKQTSNGGNFRFLNMQVTDQLSHVFGIEKSELPYLHFPKSKTFSREECGYNPVRFFVIVSMQRSGTGWFETLLNSHINVSCNGEVFNKERSKNTSIIIETLDRVYNLDFFTSAAKNDCSAAVGFKWMLNQGLMKYHEDVVEYFNTRGVSVIFLFRKNLLRRMISSLANNYDIQAKLLNGTHKSHTHSPKEAQILANYKPKINATSIVRNLKKDEEIIGKALEYFKSTRHILLYYEDVVNNQTKLVEVQEFLKLPYKELRSGQVKIHKGPLSKQIENLDEVKKALNGTTYQSLLNADKKL